MASPILSFVVATLATVSPSESRGQNLAPVASRTSGHLAGFSSLVVAQVRDVIGLDRVPQVSGRQLLPATLVTLAPTGITVFDRSLAVLTDGRLQAEESPPACAGHCPGRLFQRFQALWLSYAIEATQHAVEIPSRVAFAVDRGITMSTLLPVMYSVAASRPVRPPELSLVVNANGKALQALPLFLLPPGGLVLGPGSAALGLKLEFGGGHYVLTASDPRFPKRSDPPTLAQIPELLRDLRRSYPSKLAIILVPAPDVTADELATVIGSVQVEFPQVVLSAGQDVMLR